MCMSHALSAAREANIVAAAALAIADRQRQATERSAPHGASAPAALVALHQFMRNSSIDGLAGVLGLTHSGTVRLVDRLAAAGLVERRGSADGRAVALRLTAAGRRNARRIMREREQAMNNLLAPLSSDERAQLTELLGRVIDGMVNSHAEAGQFCRLCDSTACGHPEHCPCTQAYRHAVV